MDLFQATDKLSGEVKIGPWDEICELDKRAWHVVPYEMAEVPVEPLCTLHVITHMSDGEPRLMRWDIMNDHELVGIYLGGCL